MKKYITAVAQETNASGEQEAAYTGILQVNVVSQENNFPVRDAEVSIAYKGDPESTVEQLTTDSSGQTDQVSLAAPPLT